MAMDMSTCTPQELTLLDDFLSITDAQGLGVATGEAVANVLQTDAVGLDLRVLADIWAICDPEFKGFLNREEVAALLRIIGWMQEGAQLSPELVHQSGPCAIITHPLMPSREQVAKSGSSSPSAAPDKGKAKEDPNQPFQPLSLAEMEVISQTTHDPIHCERAMRSLMDCFNKPEFDGDLVLQGLNVLAVCLGTGADQVGNYWRIHLESFGLLIQRLDDAPEATPQITAIRQRLVEIIELLLDEHKLATHRTAALKALQAQPRDQPGLSPVVESRPSPIHDGPQPPSHQNSTDLLWEEDQAYEAALRRIIHGGPASPASMAPDRSIEASRIASQATNILDLLKVQSEQDDDAAALEEALKASKLALEANRILLDLHEQSRAAAEEEELELALRLSREEEERSAFRFHDSNSWGQPAKSSSYFPGDIKQAPSPFDDTYSISRSPSPNPVALPPLHTPSPIPPLPPASGSIPHSPARDEPPMSPLRRESSGRRSIPVPSPPSVERHSSTPLIVFEDLSNPGDGPTSSPEHPASQEFMDSVPEAHSRQSSPPPGSDASPSGQPPQGGGSLRAEISRRPESPAGGEEPPPPYDPGY